MLERIVDAIGISFLDSKKYFKNQNKIFYTISSNNIKLIKENYTNLKNKLGRIPKLKDFDELVNYFKDRIQNIIKFEMSI